MKQKALSKRVAAVEKLAADLGAAGVVGKKKKHVGNGAFYESSVRYTTDTAVLFCLEDFFSKPEFCSGVLEDQRRNARKRRHRDIGGSGSSGSSSLSRAKRWKSVLDGLVKAQAGRA